MSTQNALAKMVHHIARLHLIDPSLKPAPDEVPVVPVADIYNLIVKRLPNLPQREFDDAIVRLVSAGMYTFHTDASDGPSIAITQKGRETELIGVLPSFLRSI